MGFFSGFKRFFFLFGLIGIFGCGGPDPRVYQKRGLPGFDPVVQFRGGRSGWYILSDRNGTVLDTGIVRRSCQLDQCTDEYTRYVTGGTENRSFQWRVSYNTEGRTILHLTDQQFRMEGTADGAYLELRGLDRIPGSLDKSTRTKVELTALRGEGSPVLEIKKYSYFGLSAGTLLVHWQDGGR